MIRAEMKAVGEDADGKYSTNTPCTEERKCNDDILHHHTERHTALNFTCCRCLLCLYLGISSKTCLLIMCMPAVPLAFEYLKQVRFIRETYFKQLHYLH